MVAAWKAGRYFSGNPHLRSYVTCKCLTDPVYPFLARRLAITNAPILDVGCGPGALGAFLRASGHRSRYLGLDPDSAKVESAKKALGHLGCDFLVADASSLPEHQGVVVMLDVLHYIEPSRRSELFGALGRRLAITCALYVRTTLRDRSWRYRVTQLEESFIKAVGWIPMPSLAFPTREEILIYSKAAGLEINLQPMWGCTPFNSYLCTLHRSQVIRSD